MLYAATQAGGVFKSSDGGDRWSAFNAGLDDPWVWSVLPTDHGRRLWAGARSAGLFVLERSGLGVWQDGVIRDLNCPPRR